MRLRRPVSRRAFVRGALASAAIIELQQTAKALGFGPAAPVCKLQAEQEVGPFYLSRELLRSDIREGKAGLPLALHVAVLDARTCQPLPHASVDVWHCDAMGMYSGFTAQPAGGFGGPGGPPPPPHDSFDDEAPAVSGENHAATPPRPPRGFPPPNPKPTDALTFLRGVQITDADGAVRFQTIFPGFYPGRTNHIHFKVRLAEQVAAPHASNNPDMAYAAGHVSHTGQIFFPEDVTSALMRQGPYAEHTIHRVTPAEDAVFLDQDGHLSIAGMSPLHDGKHLTALTAKLIVAVDPTSTPLPARRGPDHSERP